MQPSDPIDNAIECALNEEANEIPVPDVAQAYGRLQALMQKKRNQQRSRLAMRVAVALFVLVGAVSILSRPGYALFGWEQRAQFLKDFVSISISSKGRNLPKLEPQTSVLPDMPEIVNQLPFSPGFPTVLPSGFQFLDATVNTTASPIVQLRLRYGNSSGGDLIVTQVNITANGGGAEVFPGAQARDIRIGTVDGVILTQEDGRHRLTYTLDRVHFTMTGNLDENTLITIAKSIR